MDTASIAAAIAKAQAKMVQPKKDRTVEVQTTKGVYTFSYATLDSVIEVVRGPLTENGIAFIQATAVENGQLCIVTRLLHESGEEIRSSLPIPGGQNVTAQQLGSAISYAKRYALSSLLGIVAAEDDDANIAEGNTTKQRGGGKGAARAQDVTPARANSTNKEVIEGWRLLNRALAKAGCDIVTQDHPQYVDLRRWMKKQLENSLNAPVPLFSELTAAQLETARTMITDWLATGELKPWKMADQSGGELPL